MGKEQELLQAVKNGDLVSTQKLLSKLKSSRNSEFCCSFTLTEHLHACSTCSDSEVCVCFPLELLSSNKRLNINFQDCDG